MVAVPRLARLTLPIAPLGAIAMFLLAAAAGVLVPGSLLESLVLWSGLPRWLPPATPPLGGSARLLFALVAGVGAGAAGWATLFLIAGKRRIAILPRARRLAEPVEGVPIIRRADAHPDAPARRPIFAEQDLGEPFLAIRAADSEATVPDADRALEEQGLPGDLDLPLAAFDPAAVPDQPREPVRAVPSLARPAPLAPGERIATFAPDPVPGIGPVAEPASLDTLLRRLEESARRRLPQRPAPIPNPHGSLEETLTSLRRLARSA